LLTNPLACRVGVNTTTPPIEKINSINSWADVRNAEVQIYLHASTCLASLLDDSDAPLYASFQGLPVNSNQRTSG